MPNSVAELLAEAAALPLRDAAYAIWRQKLTFERLEVRVRSRRDRSTPEAREKSMRESMAQIRYEDDFAQDGPTFDRLKRAHPRATDSELKQAVSAAVKFDDDCFHHLTKDGEKYREGDAWENVVRAVARAAQDDPGYLETTYHDACNWVAYNMK
jgi:hypothetical protein